MGRPGGRPLRKQQAFSQPLFTIHLLPSSARRFATMCVIWLVDQGIDPYGFPCLKAFRPAFSFKFTKHSRLFYRKSDKDFFKKHL